MENVSLTEGSLDVSMFQCINVSMHPCLNVPMDQCLNVKDVTRQQPTNLLIGGLLGKTRIDTN